ncbi:MAG: alpha/beta fold hydrolase [Actinomycetota bacterium]|nr:alpha/beta fold hydrolase [Actinomycetota bacterium]
MVRYVRRADTNIAFQTFGDGPIDLLFVPNWINDIEAAWDEPSYAGFLRSLGAFSRVSWFDKRGTGLSDPIPISDRLDLDSWVQDVEAVRKAVGAGKPVLFGAASGGPICISYAAQYPDHVAALVLYDSYATLAAAEDVPWGFSPEAARGIERRFEAEWAEGPYLDVVAPTLSGDARFRSWWAHYRRHASSPGTARALRRLSNEIDVRSQLPLVQAPTLVVHRSGDRYILVEHGRYLARRIAGAILLEVRGDDHLFFVGDASSIVAEVAAFLARVLDRTEIRRLSASSRRKSARWGWESITAAERRVVDLVLEGLSNNEIAVRLHLSKNTVDAHLKSVYRKLGVRSRSGLISLAREQHST